MQRQNRLMTWVGLCLLLLCAATEAGSATLVSDTRAHARRGQLAYANGVLHAVDGEGQDIFYRRSTNGGQTWSAGTNLGTSGLDTTPILKVAGSNVYVAFRSDDAVANFFEVYFTRSQDGGLNFEPLQLLSPNDRVESYVTGLDASADGSRVVLTYYDSRR